MKLSILMAGLHNRPRKIEQQIATQINRLPPFCDIEQTKVEKDGLITEIIKPKHHEHLKAEFISLIDDGQVTSGEKRNTLTSLATGDYICFIDDDDRVSDDYVKKLLFGCLSNADIITFKLKLIHNGVDKETWQFGMYPNLRRFGLMCVNHLCAWKKHLATLVKWDPLLGNSDDRVWFEPIYNNNVINTQYHINDILYYYKYDSLVTTNQKAGRVAFAKEYIKKGFRCFTDSENSIYVETNPKTLNFNPLPIGQIYVRNSKNEYVVKQLIELKHYHTIKI